MILLIDNYDSFVHNLARYFRELGCRTHVVRNDRLTVNEAASLQPAGIVLSPGPGEPGDAGLCVELVRRLHDSVPMLGVCLGHQAIAAAFGMDIVRAPEPVHGRTSDIFHDGGTLFAGLPSPFRAARYHSLLVDERSVPQEFLVPARSREGLMMALVHRRFPVFGVQFHPESVLTEHGHPLLGNFLRAARIEAADSVAGETPPVEDRDDEPVLSQPLHW